MQQKRLEYVDFIKGVAMLMVIFCHREVIPDDSVMGTVLMMLTYSAVPCLLMCSGYVLLPRRERSRRSFERAAHVYLCMVIWKALYLLYFQLLNPVEKDPVTLIQYLFLFCPMEGVETEHFWFMQAYLPILLITPLLSPMFAQRRYGMIAAFAGLVYLSNQFLMSANLIIQLASSYFGFAAFELDQLSHVFPFGGEYSSMLLCFMLGGVHWLLEEKKLTRRPWFLAASLLCAVGGAACMMCVRYLQMGSFRWQGELLIAKYEWSSTLIMSFGVFGLLRHVGETRPAQWLARHAGRHSMGIYYLHYPLLMLLVIHVYPVLPQALWVNAAKTILLAVVCVLITKLGKHVPLVRELLR